nr:unnamed protein product [Digitaria exilis]
MVLLARVGDAGGGAGAQGQGDHHDGAEEEFGEGVAVCEEAVLGVLDAMRSRLDAAIQVEAGMVRMARTSGCRNRSKIMGIVLVRMALEGMRRQLDVGAAMRSPTTGKEKLAAGCSDLRFGCRLSLWVRESVKLLFQVMDLTSIEVYKLELINGWCRARRSEVCLSLTLSLRKRAMGREKSLGKMTTWRSSSSAGCSGDVSGELLGAFNGGECLQWGNLESSSMVEGGRRERERE